MILLILVLDFLKFSIEDIVIFLPDKTLDKSTSHKKIFGLRL